jgi:hypothetical protein
LSINSNVTVFDHRGQTDDASTSSAIDVLAGQLVGFRHVGSDIR